MNEFYLKNAGSDVLFKIVYEPHNQKPFTVQINECVVHCLPETFGQMVEVLFKSEVE